MKLLAIFVIMFSGISAIAGPWEGSMNTSQGLFQFSSGSHNISIIGDANYQINENVQFSGALGFTSIDLGASSTSVFQVLAGAVYNFGNPYVLNNSMFAGARIGLTSASSSTNFTWQTLFGKRFPISDKLTFKPTFTISQITGGGNVTFTLRILSFSYFF